MPAAAGSKVVLEPHHQYQADGPNSDGQGTTVQGLDAAAANGVVERTPSSSPVHMSNSPPLQPGKGRGSGSPSAHQPQFEGGTQQSQQLQGQGSGLFQHKQPTATGDRQQNRPAASLPAAQSFQQSMQQLSAAFEGPETGDDVYDAEEGSPQSEVRCCAPAHSCARLAVAAVTAWLLDGVVLGCCLTCYTRKPSCVCSRPSIHLLVSSSLLSAVKVRHLILHFSSHCRPCWHAYFPAGWSGAVGCHGSRS
jgi:hypothetical protein